MKEAKYKIGENYHFSPPDSYGQWVSIEIMAVKKTIFGNYKYLCKYGSRWSKNYPINYNVQWVKEKNIF